MKDNVGFDWRSNWRIILLVLGSIWLFSMLIASSLRVNELSGNVALIRINGVIMGSDSFSFGSVTNPRNVVDLLEKAKKLPNIKSVLLVINSPGGSPVACEDITREVDSLKEGNKTVIALIKDMGTSGAYWIATSADFIVASNVSIVGSVGVYSSYLVFSGLMNKYGVYYNRLVSGDYKDIGTPLRNMSEEERKIFNERLRLIHEYFLNDVVKRRNLSEEEKKEVSKALFYTGGQALNLGLIDKVGGKKEVLDYLRNIMDEEPVIVEFKTKTGFIESLSSVLFKSNIFLGYGLGLGIYRSDIGRILGMSNFELSNYHGLSGVPYQPYLLMNS